MSRYMRSECTMYHLRPYTYVLLPPRLHRQCLHIVHRNTRFATIFTFPKTLVKDDILVPLPVNPCSPSPCGPNSQCREINAQAVCSCLPGFIGSPPTCRPECVSSNECSLSQACVNQKCIDPCPGTCGIAAKCQVVNHNPICSCASGQTGDPFVRCYPIRK